MDLEESSPTNTSKIENYINSIRNKDRELILKDGEMVLGAILTAEQYSWFLDQLDDAQDYSYLDNLNEHTEGLKTLDELDKEISGHE